MGKEFLVAELRTGMTFINLARTDVTSDRTAAQRNRKNALKAYESYLKFRTRVALNDSETLELETLAAELRSSLQQLGEKIA